MLNFIELYEQPQDCFFVPRGDNYCPGWAIGETHLPCSEKCRGKFYLVRDATGETWWTPACKVSFRGQSHHFQTRTGESFDWNRIVELNKLPIDYLAKPADLKNF